MPNFGNLSEEQIKKFLKVISPDDVLFKQDDLGNTMFIIISGTLDLLEHRGEQQFLIGTLSAGQVLGEKALLTEAPYRRTYTARASTEVSLLEFDNKNLKIVEAIIPNFTARILQIAAKRLDRANKIISILRSLDSHERMIATLHFYIEDAGNKTPDGIEIAISVADIDQICNVGADFIKDCLDELCLHKVMRKTKAGFLVPDENALNQMLPDLRLKIAA